MELICTLDGLKAKRSISKSEAMITPHEYNLVLRECKDLLPAKGMYLVNDYIENLMLTVLDFQMHNVAVEKAIAHYRDNRRKEIKSLNDLKHLLTKHADDEQGNMAVAQYLWGNKHWTRVSLLRKLVAYFESIGVIGQEDLTRWAKTSSFERDFKCKIPGMDFAIFKWLIMRQGVETVKPDIHLRRFIESIVHHSVSDHELVRVLEKVAEELDLKAYELDWRIWEYQRGMRYLKTTPISTIDTQSRAGVTTFIDDDAGYLNWVKSNPQGFVLNCERNPRPTYLYLHRATCFAITGRPTSGKLLTKDYIKICSSNREQLEQWAKREVEGLLHPCRICNP